MRRAAREVPKLRKQIADLLAEVTQLRPIIEAYKRREDFFTKALAMLIGFEPELNTQHGMTKTVKAVKEARRQLRGEDPAPPPVAAMPEAPKIDAEKQAAAKAGRKPRAPRAPRPGRPHH